MPVAQAALTPVSAATQEQAQASQSVTCLGADATTRQNVVQMINEVRGTARSCGTEFYSAAPAVHWNPQLSVAASRHSDDMASTNFFSHTGSDGSSVSERVEQAGYAWSTVGENIAAGQSTVRDAVDGWVASAGHCKNLMNPDFTEVAVGCSTDSAADYDNYWTNVLAAPPSF